MQQLFISFSICWKKKHIFYLIKGENIGAEPCTLPLVTLDTSGSISNNHATRNDKISGEIRVKLDQSRPGWTRFASRQSNIIGEIVAKPNNGNGLLRGGLRVEEVKSHGAGKSWRRWRAAARKFLSTARCVNDGVVNERKRRPFGVVAGLKKR